MRFFPGTCLIILIGVNYMHAQSPSKVDKEWVFSTSHLVKKELHLSAKGQPVFDFPYLENIEVIDARPDSLGMGFQTRNSEKKNNLFVFDSELKTAFENFIRSTAKFHGGNDAYMVHMVVKEFWVKEFEVDMDDKDKELDKTFMNTFQKKTSLKANFDFYFSKNGEYFAAYRFDTLATGFLNFNEFTEAYLSGILHYSIARLQTINPSNFTQNKRRFSRPELIAHYQEKWKLPLLKDSQYVRGVYKNFSEFVNNRPSIAQFEVRKNQLADVLYVPNNGQEMIPIRDVWGYCDGKNLYIKSGENYFMLVRIQNSFYFLGSQELIKEGNYQHNNNEVFDPFNRPMPANNEVHLRNRLLPLKVDMDKGTIY